MNTAMIFVKDKTLYIQFSEILKTGDCNIYNPQGKIVFQCKLKECHYEEIYLDQPQGKYRIHITSTETNIKKSIHIK